MTVADLEIVYDELPCPSQTEVIFTRNARLEHIRCLLCASYGQQLYSRDDLPRVQSTLNRFAGRPNYQGKFASLAARISRKHKMQSDTLRAFGDITLVVDPDTIRKDAVIFSGDFQNIGANRISSNGTVEGVTTWQATEDLSRVARELDDAMHASQVCGQYFEVRLYRALTPTDLIKIYAPDADDSVKEKLRKLTKIRGEMLNSR